MTIWVIAMCPKLWDLIYGQPVHAEGVCYELPVPPHAYVFLPFGSMKPQAVQSLRNWVPPVNDSSKLQFSPSHFAQPGVTLNILNLSEFSQP